MKTARWLLLIVLVAALARAYYEQAKWVYPTPETQSLFLKAYGPNEVIDRFAVDKRSQMSGGRSDGAGEGFVTHQLEFEPTVLIRTSDWVALNQTLRDDVAARLTAHDGDIIHESGNATDGFKIWYAMGKSEGTVTLGPLKSLAGSALGPGADGPGLATIRAHIQIDEKWFKAGRKDETRFATSR